MFESSDSGFTNAVNKHPHYVGVASLSVFGGNFVLAKVRQGLISVRCSKLRGVRFSEVQFYGKINRGRGGEVIRLLYRGFLLFEGSVIRGFTVLVFKGKKNASYFCKL